MKIKVVEIFVGYEPVCGFEIVEAAHAPSAFGFSCGKVEADTFDSAADWNMKNE